MDARSNPQTLAFNHSFVLLEKSLLNCYGRADSEQGFWKLCHDRVSNRLDHDSMEFLNRADN